MHALIAFFIGPVGRYVAIGVALVAIYHAGEWRGATNERQAAIIAGFKKATERAVYMEKNNVEFRTMSERDRCRVLALDSGLPKSICD